MSNNKLNLLCCQHLSLKKRKTANAIKMRKKAKKQQDGGSSVVISYHSIWTKEIIYNRNMA